VSGDVPTPPVNLIICTNLRLGDGAIQVLSYNISGAVWQGGADGGLLIVDILRGKSDASPESLYLPNTPAGDTTPATLKYPVADTSHCIVIGRASLTVPPVAGNRPVLEVQKSGPTAGGAVKVDGTNSLLLVVHSVGFNTNTNLQVNVTGVVYIQWYVRSFHGFFDILTNKHLLFRSSAGDSGNYFHFLSALMYVFAMDWSRFWFRL
jgi:hypothetical protein